LGASGKSLIGKMIDSGGQGRVAGGILWLKNNVISFFVYKDCIGFR
jgi:hypothetical protein